MVWLYYNLYVILQFVCLCAYPRFGAFDTKFAITVALTSVLCKFWGNLFFKASKRSISYLSRFICLIYTTPPGEFAEGQTAVRDGEHFFTDTEKGGLDWNLSPSVLIRAVSRERLCPTLYHRELFSRPQKLQTYFKVDSNEKQRLQAPSCCFTLMIFRE